MSVRGLAVLILALLGTGVSRVESTRLQDIENTVLPKMHTPTSLFLMCVLTGSTCAVFYTKSTDTDYPRIGRRSFYTSGNGNHYPRIGRRDAGPTQILLPGSTFSDLSAMEKRGVFTEGKQGSYPRIGRSGELDLSGMDKRGVFTQGKYGSYPRVGRSGEVDSGEEFLGQDKLFEKIAGLKGDVEDSDMRRANENNGMSHVAYPLDILFIAFDSDTDGKLTKEEFVTGMNKYRQQNPLC